MDVMLFALCFLERQCMEAMSDSSCNSGIERIQMSSSVLPALDSQRKQPRTGLRRWVRGLDRVSEGAHVWPASALLTLGTFVIVVVWLCHMSTPSGRSALYSALELESVLYDVITTLRHEQQCSTPTCRTSSPLR